MIGCYPARLREAVQGRIEGGELSLRGLVDQQSITQIDVREKFLSQLKNINSPSDLPK